MRFSRIGRARDERGAVALVAALGAVVLFLAAALAVDMGNTWARRGQLQVQADRAALFAAQFLPARSQEQKVVVAKAAAYYIACHPVLGQADLDADIPACPDGPGSAELEPYSAKMLDADWVTFPTTTQVGVRTPPARVEFGFGRTTTEGSTQQKQAIAKIGTPGILSPMAVSLDCILSPLANLTALGLPFGYISTTHRGSPQLVVPSPSAGNEAPPWPASATIPSLTLSLSTGELDQGTTAPGVVVSGRCPRCATNTGPWRPGPSQRLFVVFAKGSPFAPVAVAVVPELDSVTSGHADLTVPSTVLNSVGTWEVKVAVGATPQTAVYLSPTMRLEIKPPPPVEDQVSCGRLLKSPRGGTQENANFALNLRSGLDHQLTRHPSLVTLSTPTDTQGLISQVSGSGDLTCRQQSGGVSDTNGVRDGEIPNCVVTDMSNAYEAGFTEGMIGPDGRLTCTEDRPCANGSSFELNGLRINDDEFKDFVKNPASPLPSSTFFNATTFLNTGLPVVTPQSALKRDVYGSHRFMWVAVISTVGATSRVEAGDYPVLTFRPIFVTQSSGLDLIPDPGGLLEIIDTRFRSALQGSTDQHGLIMDGADLSAVRFMTIEPDALPAVPSDYSGPVTEYLGVGPKIVRLVR